MNQPIELPPSEGSAAPQASAPTYDRPALEQMLTACQLRLTSDGHGPQAQPLDLKTSFAGKGFMAALPELGVIEVSGADSASFLQGQLTNDIVALPVGSAQWSGLCSPKGRLLANFLVLRTEQSILLLIHRELAASIAKRLSMYVLRAKAKVLDSSATMMALGLVGGDAVAALQTVGLALPAPMQLTQGASAIAIGLPALSSAAESLARALVVVDASELAGQWATLSAVLPARESAWWRASEVASGVARIYPATQDAFVPQMVNFELIGGVDFAKGCYTGQEVVARSQYLGKLKRRMFLAAHASQPAPGTGVLDASGAIIGMVVASAPGQALGMESAGLVLFESGVEVAGNGRIQDQALELLALPYVIPEPTPFARPR